ncbi:MAG: BamA/TamA family outer membrane protein, partial [Proteobacteria bacterium]|nr:BamA/TamA family outer membrane protein [Pseudomonadota bacterium]
YKQINKEKKEKTKDMHLEVTEKKAGAFEIGLGYATDIGARAFSELSYVNLWGTARSIKLRGEVNDLEKKVLLGYMEPWLLGKQMDGRINLLHQSTDKDSYDLKKDGLILGIDKQLSDFLEVSLQYEIDKNTYSNVQPGTTQAEGESTIASLGPLLIRDSRDDPFNPVKGSVNLLRYELAKEAFASDEEFQKMTAQSSWYKAITENSVGAVSLRGGYIDLLGSTTSIPIDKRFFLGGRTTVRGFRQDSIGPKNALGGAIGGEKMLNFNAEIRMRLIGNLGGLLFYDAGNVWASDETARLSDMRTAAGVGLRYLTPVGPLSLEYGHKLDRKKDESAGEWYFTIGNIF